MPSEVDPSLNRRKLRIALRKAREEAGQTQGGAAGDLEWSLSKLNRIEKGTVSVSVTDLRALLRQYGVDDEERVTELVSAARGSKGQSWWVQWSDIANPRFTEYLPFEAAADSLRTYHPIIMPGLLHTEEYADALSTPEVSDPGTRRRLVEFRTARQERVFDESGIGDLHFVVDESALRRQIGGPSVMRAQLQRLIEVAEHPRATLQVLPYSAGALLSTQNAFVLLGFKDDDDLIYLESAQSVVATRDDYEMVANFQDCFEQLRQIAYSDSRAIDLINEVKEGFAG
ncbi:MULTISPECIES: helix-turn-helix domain-containing protein [Streptomyces]|uniref:Transcriptional regulator n=1 Tax=Streptomyces lasiicapitis TaxID=1923961 RepID=A0ABQ2MDE9_9ACTN|nr:MULTISPECIES: helix-turn-helix transcriptional regulator [Streptomyces]QIB46550.1 helix-turn-helix domain-containing protein [Streptomyces aureoverticillatus]GGO49825.1 transcriptional regulator [Streptomyces lasiicapitis]